MLACVILPRANRKARTKPICLWGVQTHLGIFSVLLWVGLSYINRGVSIIVRYLLLGCMRRICRGLVGGGGVCLVK